ncbi:MAG TPA: YicC family protein [Aliiroseovarius sp.]|nr:YicC family protein [Aliiroseovarius sp.]
MTGYATLKGQLGAFSWVWDMRAVNARGLDIRLRLPDWIAGLEPALRKAIGGAVARGSVNVTLKLQRDGDDGVATINAAGLDRALALIAEIDHQAVQHGVTLAPPTAVDIAAMRGVVETGTEVTDTAPLFAALTAQLPELLAAFNAMRASEGAALNAVLEDQLDQVTDLVSRASALVKARRAAQADTLRSNLARVLDNTDGADADRVAQELALIAVKSDIQEEIDRLAAHVAAARSLLKGAGVCGRKLDFLMQEFNREANTLCSKSQFQDLTAIGLDLKHVIDQMREQVQNVE